MSTLASSSGSGDDYDQRLTAFRDEHSAPTEPAAVDSPTATQGSTRYADTAPRADVQSTPDGSVPPSADSLETTRTISNPAPPATAGRPYGAVATDLGVDRATVVNREKESMEA